MLVWWIFFPIFRVSFFWKSLGPPLHLSGKRVRRSGVVYEPSSKKEAILGTCYLFAPTQVTRVPKMVRNPHRYYIMLYGCYAFCKEEKNHPQKIASSMNKVQNNSILVT